MQAPAYLQRIRYTASTKPNIETLRSLQRQHLLAVPFENLDIHYQRPILLDLERIYQKIVREDRGGFCYELNGLYHWLLTKLGFEAKLISARVYDAKKQALGPELVTLEEGVFLTDVGFGEFAFFPLALEMEQPQEDPRGMYLVKRVATHYEVYQLKDGQKQLQYSFTPKTQELSAFEELCHYHQNSPHSHFTQKPMISKPLPNKGRITLAGRQLKIVEEGKTVNESRLEGTNYAEALHTWFGIEEKGLRKPPF